MRQRPGVKPLFTDQEFIDAYRFHNGDISETAKELGKSYNSTYVQCKRLEKRYGGNLLVLPHTMEFEETK